MDPLSTLMPIVRPFEAAHAAALKAAAAADGHIVLAPSHVIIKRGRIAGYVGLNSMPTFQGWFDRQVIQPRDSAMIFNQVENLCRMQGMKHLLLLLPTTSEFAGVIEKFGYEKLADVGLCVKTL